MDNKHNYTQGAKGMTNTDKNDILYGDKCNKMNNRYGLILTIIQIEQIRL